MSAGCDQVYCENKPTCTGSKNTDLCEKTKLNVSYLLSNADEMKNIILDCAIVQKGATTPCLYLYLVAKYEEWYP